MKTIQDVIDFYDTHDWISGHYYDGKNGYCLSGAVMKVCGANFSMSGAPSDFDGAAFMQLSRDLRVKLGHDSVPGWNDTVPKSKEEVLAALA